MLSKLLPELLSHLYDCKVTLLYLTLLYCNSKPSILFFCRSLREKVTLRATMAFRNKREIVDDVQEPGKYVQNHFEFTPLGTATPTILDDSLWLNKLVFFTKTVHVK